MFQVGRGTSDYPLRFRLLLVVSNPLYKPWKGYLEEELGDFLTMVINHFLNGMILQVNERWHANVLTEDIQKLWMVQKTGYFYTFI